MDKPFGEVTSRLPIRIKMNENETVLTAEFKEEIPVIICNLGC